MAEIPDKQPVLPVYPTVPGRGPAERQGRIGERQPEERRERQRRQPQAEDGHVLDEYA